MEDREGAKHVAHGTFQKWGGGGGGAPTAGPYLPISLDNHMVVGEEVDSFENPPSPAKSGNSCS